MDTSTTTRFVYLLVSAIFRNTKISFDVIKGVKDEQNLIRRNRKIVVEQKEMNPEIVLYNGAGYTTHVVYIYMSSIYLSKSTDYLTKTQKNPIP
jgi:hypothetical protein